MFSKWELIKQMFLKERKFLFAAFCAGSVFTATVCISASLAYSEQVSEDIAGELIRFHVRANSNSDEDQKLKEFVRENVLDYLYDGLSESSSKSETCELLYSRLEDVKGYAEQIIKEKGYDYGVTAELTREFFPTKIYGDIALPAGEYDALRIDIGNADGKNWWCVMFPPLCYVDITRDELPTEEKERLKSILDDESYALVTKSTGNDDLPIKVKFKVVELWQNLMSGGSNPQPASLTVQSSDDVISLETYGPILRAEYTAAASQSDFIRQSALRYHNLSMSAYTPPVQNYVAVQEHTPSPQDYTMQVENPAPTEIPIETPAVDNIKDGELMLLASIINGEARGEQYEGQVAVGAVVLNRVAHPAFPDTIREVIYQPGAFDAVRDGQIDLTPTDSCIQAAGDALNGADPTNGAIYYWNPKTATSRWINNVTVTMAIGNHNFGMH